jgi:hypothetical protein
MRALWARPDETPKFFFKNLVDSDDLELISVKRGILDGDKSFMNHYRVCSSVLYLKLTY